MKKKSWKIEGATGWGCGDLLPLLQLSRPWSSKSQVEYIPTAIEYVLGIMIIIMIWLVIWLLWLWSLAKQFWNNFLPWSGFACSHFHSILSPHFRNLVFAAGWLPLSLSIWYCWNFSPPLFTPGWRWRPWAGILWVGRSVCTALHHNWLKIFPLFILCFNHCTMGKLTKMAESGQL